MDYDGPNAALVNEVIGFFSGDRLLAGADGHGLRRGVRTLTEIEKAVAINTEETFAVDSAGESDEDFEYSWGDLLDNLAAELIYTSEWYRWKKEHKSAWDKLAWPFSHTSLRHFRGRVPDEFVGHVAEEVWDVLQKCAENRAFNGRTQNFWERLLKIYFQGLWPCGWEGRWPKPGRFVAWSPKRAGR